MSKCLNKNKDYTNFLFLERIGGYVCLEYKDAVDILYSDKRFFEEYKIYDDELELIKNFVESKKFKISGENSKNLLQELADGIYNFFNFNEYSSKDLEEAIKTDDIDSVKQILESSPELANQCIRYNSKNKCLRYPLYLAKNQEIYNELSEHSNPEILYDTMKDRNYTSDSSNYDFKKYNLLDEKDLEYLSFIFYKDPEKFISENKKQNFLSDENINKIKMRPYKFYDRPMGEMKKNIFSIY